MNQTNNIPNPKIKIKPVSLEELLRIKYIIALRIKKNKPRYPIIDIQKTNFSCTYKNLSENDILFEFNFLVKINATNFLKLT